MNHSKRFKRENANRTVDDDIIVIQPITSSEFCQHIDRTTDECCKEYYSVVCIHCNLHLCYMHVEMHRILLINERDQLINELNARIDELNQLIENPKQLEKLLIEHLEVKHQMKISFLQQLSTLKLIDLNRIIMELKQIFQPIRNNINLNQCVSLFQIKNIKETLMKFDESKKVN